MDDLGRPALRHDHVQGIEDKLGPETRRHRPPHDPATPCVEDDGEIEEAGPRRHVGDVRHPRAIGPVGSEGALDEIRRRAARGIAAGGRDEGTSADAGQAGRLQQPGDPLAAHVDSWAASSA
jgi:hypothetical protein